ncbi:MAG: tRNA glutamyl-Q(34) synthetase GluQRS [Gammaproteobacteria bacterium]|nr:tRNA glutamyl-Q(34) synthetase GluQRS [Gammaproteobacteria bacterium]
MTKAKHQYRGRFAPSPSGKLHFGSLVAAMGSYLQAKSQQGQWLVRIEDIDQTRTIPGSADLILSTLDKLGFEWDKEVLYQSNRTEHYQYYLQQLKEKGLIYACDCSRSKLRLETSSPVYSGHCRKKTISASSPRALRCLTTTETVIFNDKIQGTYSVDIERECGDFIVKRRDGFFAYQLAVVVDDAEQGISEVIRGADLLSSTPQQIYLQQQLGFTTSAYGHLPIAMYDNGRKLSKSHQDLSLEQQSTVEIMTKALTFLNQSPPQDLALAPLHEFWQWALQHWDIDSIKASQQASFNI